MFESVAPSELLIVAIVALVVIGPKDLPKVMRWVGQWVGKARAMARHFRSGIDTMMREAELEEMEAKWRAHNEAIMKAYPDLGVGPPSVSAIPAPLAGVVAPPELGDGPPPVMTPISPIAADLTGDLTGDGPAATATSADGTPVKRRRKKAAAKSIDDAA